MNCLKMVLFYGSFVVCVLFSGLSFASEDYSDQLAYINSVRNSDTSQMQIGSVLPDVENPGFEAAIQAEEAQVVQEAVIEPVRYVESSDSEDGYY